MSSRDCTAPAHDSPGSAITGHSPDDRAERKAWEPVTLGEKLFIRYSVLSIQYTGVNPS